MGMTVEKDERSGDGWTILAKTVNRKIDIDLEAGGISLTLWPMAVISRAQWWAVAQASMPTRHGGCFSKKART